MSSFQPVPLVGVERGDGQDALPGDDAGDLPRRAA